MSKSKFAEKILETIDTLRSRKARPDLARICHMVKRSNISITSEDVQNTLAAMVAENFVIKVNYKGNISYRNPAKWKRRKRGVIDESPDRKSITTMRAKLPKKKLLKLKAVKAVLTKTKGKRGRPPLKKKMKVKPPSDVDEETEEEVLDNSVATQACDEPEISEICDESKESEKVTQKKGSEKSDIESVPDLSADETASSLSSKGGLGRQTGQKGSTKYELVKGKRGNGRSTSNLSGSTKLSNAESDQSSNENSSSNVLGEGSKLETQSKLISPKKIKLVAHKRRKFKKSLGPDFQSYSSVKKSRHDVSEKSDNKSSSSTSEKDSKDLKCDYCLQTAASNRIGEPEDLLICKDCQAKAHPSCMDYSEELARRACRSPWQCIDCKTCSVCNDSGDADAMLFCDACDKGYHMNCHQPPINEKPKGKWVCCKCVLELGVADEVGKDENDEVNPDLNMNESIPTVDSGGASCLPTPNDSPVHFNEEANGNKLSSKLSPNVVAPLPRLAATLTLEVPDASSWTIVDVVRFFSEMGFTEHAESFREQEIDGRALLLMTRMDVLTGLSLKLGPALKIYVHIQRLQAKHLNSH